jgi:hypothetical protein
MSGGWQTGEGHGFKAGVEEGRLRLPPFGAWFGVPAQRRGI